MLRLHAPPPTASGGALGIAPRPPSKVHGRMAVAAFAVLVLLCLPWPAAGADPEGVVFLDARPLAVEVRNGGHISAAEVGILNGSTRLERLTLEVIGLPNADAEELPFVNVAPCPEEAPEGTSPESSAAPAPVEVDTTAGPVDVEPGETTCFRVTVQAAAKSEGGYAGVLAAYSSDGSIDRRDLSISITAPPVEGEASAGSLRTPMPPKIVWQTTAMPGLVRAMLNQPLDVDIPVSPQLFARDATGTLAGTNAVVPVEDPAEGEVIRIADLPGAGEYVGKLSFGPGTETELTLRIADDLWWFLATIVIGLVAADLLDRRMNRREPRLKLLIELQALRDEALRDQRDAAKRLELMGEQWPFDDRSPWEVWRGGTALTVDKGAGVLAQRSVAALTALEAQDDGAEASKTADTSLGEIRELIFELRELQLQAEEIARVRADILANVRGLERGKFGDNVGPQAIESMRSRLLDEHDDLDELKEGQSSSHGLLVAFRDALRLIEAREREFASDKELLDQLHQERAKLFLPATDAEAIADVIKAVRGIAPSAADAPLPQRGVAVRRREAPIEIDATLRRLRALLARSEALTALLAGGIVLLAALSALYVGNPTWGSVPDYLTALLWGSVGGEAVKIALRLIPVGSSLGR